MAKSRRCGADTARGPEGLNGPKKGLQRFFCRRCDKTVTPGSVDRLMCPCGCRVGAAMLAPESVHGEPVATVDFENLLGEPTARTA